MLGAAVDPAELQAAASAYSEEGFNVFPINAKTPLARWGTWLTAKQSTAEFAALQWQQATGLGVVCGTPNNQGLHLVVVDFDTKNLPASAVTKGKEALKFLPQTAAEQTPSGGLHLIYYSKKQPVTNKTHHAAAALELLGHGCYCAMAPSLGYKRLNDEPPAVVDDANAIFDEALQRAGITAAAEQKPSQRQPDTHDTAKTNTEKTPRPCITAALKQQLTGAQGHQMRLHIAAELLKCGYTTEQVINAFREQADFSFDVTLKHVQSANPNKTAKCATIKQLGYCLPNCSWKLDTNEKEEEAALYALAKKIVAEKKIVTDRATRQMYVFNGKIWEDNADTVIQEMLVAAEGEAYKPYHLTTLTQMVEALSFKAVSEPPHQLVCVENGVLDLKTLALTPHNDSYFFRGAINAEFNPSAEAPKFTSWLKQVLPDQEAQLCIQEMMGYCLLRSYPLHYLFFLVGAGRNGRSTLLRTLTAILGEENSAAVPLELLPQRFQTTNLIGKLVNIVSEPRHDCLLHTPIVKKLTGGDLVSAEYKGKQKIVQFTNYAKLIVLANELPKVVDDSYGWWERVIVIEFPIEFTEAQRVANIEQTWLSDPAERSGILNWMLEGLQRLIQNQKFTKSAKMQNAVEQYRKWSNPAQYFLNKYCSFETNTWVTKNALYEAYKIACEEEDLAILPPEAFGREVTKKPRVTATQRRVAGKITRVWLGVTLKDGKNEEQSVTGVTGVTGSLYTAQVSASKKEKGKSWESNNLPVTPVTPVTPAETGSGDSDGGGEGGGEGVGVGGVGEGAAASSVDFVDEGANVKTLTDFYKLPVGGFANWLVQFWVPPSSRRGCEGEFHGGQCPFEGEYQLRTVADVKSWFFCRGHFLRVSAAAVANGFPLLTPDGEPLLGAAGDSAGSAVSGVSEAAAAGEGDSAAAGAVSAVPAGVTCGACAKFRTPQCPHGLWAFWSGALRAEGCFAPLGGTAAVAVDAGKLEGKVGGVRRDN
ncbi:MAG: phage/plasmid primase, P4 family [Candidatus Bathyarchaeia archaeon]